MTPYEEGKYHIKSFTDELLRTKKISKLHPRQSSKIKQKFQKQIKRRISSNCLGALRRFCTVHSFTKEELPEILKIPKMTIYRWFNKEPIDKCYQSLIFNLINDFEIGENIQLEPLECKKALNKLEEFKIKLGSWDKMANALGIPKGKKTIMRWLKTGNISAGYRRMLYYFFKEHPLN